MSLRQRLLAALAIGVTVASRTTQIFELLADPQARDEMLMNSFTRNTWIALK